MKSLLEDKRVEVKIQQSHHKLHGEDSCYSSFSSCTLQEAVCVLYSLSPVWSAVVPTQQPLVTRTDLVDAERQAAVRHVAALSTNQTPLAHLLPVVSGAAHGRPTVPVHFTPGTWTKQKLVILGQVLKSI